MSRLLAHLKSAGDEPPPTDAELRAARLRTARATPAWEEIPDDLVPRLGGRCWVSAATDRVYKRTRGTIFERGSASIVAEKQPLAFTVDEDGTLTFYEVESRTWSEQVAAQARRRIKRTRR